MTPTERSASNPSRNKGFVATLRAHLFSTATPAPKSTPRATLPLALLLALAALTLTASSAQAAVTHDYLSQITGVPAGPGVSAPGPFAAMESMSVDSGHLWVAERFNGGSRADRFDASTGAFVSQLVPTEVTFSSEGGIAVGHAQAEIYTGATNEGGEPVVAVFDEAGTLQASWTGADVVPGGSFGGAITDVAVDNSTNLFDEGRGDVYVAVPSQHVIDVFKPEALGKEKFVTQLTGISPSEPFQYPSKVDVNEANGDVIVLDPNAGAVDVFEPTALGYAFVRKIPVEKAFDLAVDGGSGAANGEIFLTEGFSPTVIAQYSSTGALLDRITGVASPGGDISDVFSLAVDPASHDLYVADNRGAGNNAVKVFGPDVVIPDVTVTEPVSNLTPTSVVLNGTVNPLEAGEATCEFQYGLSTAYGTGAKCTEAVTTNGNVPVPVKSKTVEGLQPDTTYHYALDATNVPDAHTNTGEGPEDEGSFTTTGAGVHSESVSEVAATSVTFDATIDPNHALTRFYFQYGTTSAYTGEVPGGLVGSEKGDVEVQRHFQGLAPGTEYHYRVVAVSEHIEVAPGGFETVAFYGPDRTFTTQRSGEFILPDARQWQMVTPPQKQGALFSALIEPNGGPGEGAIQASAGGDAIADVASAPTEAEPQGNSGLFGSVLSTRGASGWSSQVIAPPHLKAGPAEPPLGEYRIFSADLSRAIVDPLGNFLALSPEASESTAYLHTDYLGGNVNEHCEASYKSAASCFHPLVTAANTISGGFGELDSNGECANIITAGNVPCGPLFQAGTPDLSHLVVSSPVQLTSTPIATEAEPRPNLYEWSAGRLQLLSLMPGSAVGSQHFIVAGSEHDTLLGVAARHAISDDGGRVVLEAVNGFTRVGLYLRDVLRGETVRLDLAEPGCEEPTCTASSEPQYMTASSDASRIFFRDSGRLTANSGATAVKEEVNGKTIDRKPDLYEYDLNAPAGERLTDLTPKTGGQSANMALVLGASEDGSYVYFTAAGALAPGAQPGGCESQSERNVAAGETCNLYLRHAGVTTFIARLSQKDRWDWRQNGNIQRLPARVSPHGRWLAFSSNRDLTGYDSRDALSGRPDQEVYLYDASANRLLCASCDPTGARPVGFEEPEEHRGIASLVPGWTASGIFGETFYQSRYLSDSGRLFFDSLDALVPKDVNGAQDVYQYEPEGVPAGEHACTSATASGSVVFKPVRAFEVEGRAGEEPPGCVGLISSGTSPEESTFLDASETGGDVFFLTTSKLSLKDFDSAPDVYDAHECTSASPCLPPPAAQPPPCETEASCKAAPAPQPDIFGSPASGTFSGPGNIPPPPPPKAKTAAQVRAEKLARALKACRTKHNKHKRATCEKQAHKKYGAAKKAKKATNKRRAS